MTSVADAQANWKESGVRGVITANLIPVSMVALVLMETTDLSVIVMVLKVGVLVACYFAVVQNLADQNFLVFL